MLVLGRSVTSSRCTQVYPFKTVRLPLRILSLYYVYSVTKFDPLSLYVPEILIFNKFTLHVLSENDEIHYFGTLSQTLPSPFLEKGAWIPKNLLAKPSMILPFEKGKIIERPKVLGSKPFTKGFAGYGAEPRI
jgi:hypothetical protein